LSNISVIITMAGHSRRFREAGYEGPKALLPVGEQRMIEHVVNMFDPKVCRYHIVINRNQVESNPCLIDDLSDLASWVTVTVVDNHELGPVHSALQVSGIGDDEEVIVSYCDFLVQWDFHLFLRQVQGYDGGIASFRGFHPASFGDTYYAYMRVDNQNRLLELREKRSFTDQRHEEHASVGIYYFRNWSSFRHYGKKHLEKEVREFPEVYASLLYNGMVDDGLEIVVHEVQKFLCLGTPSDIEQYQFWWRYFSREGGFGAQKNFDFRQKQDNPKRVGLVPLAGRSNRFKEYGYRVVKPLISVLDAPMVVTAARSMPQQTTWIFVARQDDLDRHPILSSLRDFNAQSIVLGVKEFTSGQAATCMLASDYIDDDAELTIASCDYTTLYDPISWNEIRNDSSIDGAIWTIRTKGLPIKNPDAFAYCKICEDGKTITEVVEKATISDTPSNDPLVVGTFWYRRALDFKRGAAHLITNDITVNGEHYVATSINHLIEQGSRFVIFDLEQWVSFGDPFELQIMEYWNDYFMR
jgi:dTDP-glucose pyrophosphorylase